jgi:hypothetical protein
MLIIEKTMFFLYNAKWRYFYMNVVTLNGIENFIKKYVPLG